MKNIYDIFTVKVGTIYSFLGEGGGVGDPLCLSSSLALHFFPLALQSRGSILKENYWFFVMGQTNYFITIELV
jgi:hypothetical protein